MMVFARGMSRWWSNGNPVSFPTEGYASIGQGMMPVLIFSWSNNAERAWEPLTSAMIIILLAFLLLMNGLVVFLRRKYERRW